MIYTYKAYAKTIYSEIPLPLEPVPAVNSAPAVDAPSDLLLKKDTITLKRGEIDTNITYSHKIEDSGIKYSVTPDHIIVAVEKVAVYKIVHSTEVYPAEVIFDSSSYPESSEKHIGLLFLHLILQFLITGTGTANQHTHTHNQFLFHGSAVSLPDNAGALVLIGEKGAGKSTLAAALSLSGCSLLCDDIVPIVTGPAVMPGVARAKLLPDAYQRLCGDPETAGEQFDGISKYYTDLPQAHSETALPLTAIIYLEQKAVTSVAISPLHGVRKFQKMIKQVIRIDGMDTAEVLFETVTANCRDIPVYRVVFPLNANPRIVGVGIKEHVEGRRETVSPGQITGLGSCFATADTENRERPLRNKRNNYA